MSISVNLSGTFYNGRVMWLNYSGWKPILNMWFNNGLGWENFYEAQVEASISPSDVGVVVHFHFISDSIVWEGGTSGTCTATASGGIGPFTYSWSATSPWNVVSPGAQSTTINIGAGDTPVSGTLTCVIRDSATGLTATASVPITYTTTTP